jgi:hypothetical protein
LVWRERKRKKSGERKGEKRECVCEKRRERERRGKKRVEKKRV